MSDIYDKAIEALWYLNNQTDYRVNNITADFHPLTKAKYGGMYGVSKYTTKESVGLLTGERLLEFAKEQGYKENE